MKKKRSVVVQEPLVANFKFCQTKIPFDVSTPLNIVGRSPEDAFEKDVVNKI